MISSSAFAPLIAQAAAPAASGGAGSSLFFLGQFVLIGLIFWFFLLRPQQKRMKEHRAMIDAVKKGDTVVTAGGIMGKATKVDQDIVEVEIASGVKVKVVKSTLTDVKPLGAAKAAND
jgi:preprotein translocase subunit YajC